MTTKREPQCTTYAQLHEHMARVYKMREGASVTVSSCVRKNGGPPTRWNNPTLWSDHPVFDGKPEEFEFALGIVEGKPVFRGDTQFANGIKFVASECKIDTFGARKHCLVSENGYPYVMQDCSWNPPRRTIKIGEIEVPAPKFIGYSYEHVKEKFTVNVEYTSKADADALIAAFKKEQP